MKLSLTGARGPAARVAASIVCMVTLSSFAAACGSTAKQSTGVASIGTDKPAADDSTDATSDATPDASDSTDDNTDPSTDDTTDTSTDDSVDPERAMVDFTECMRDNGIDMPDPQVVNANGSGNATVSGGPMIALNSVPDGEEGDPQADLGFDPNSDEFKEAQEACQSILDEAATAISIDPEVEAEHRQQMLDFAKCMRDHGIDFPDPTFNDAGGISVAVGSSEADDDQGPPPDDEAFQEANDACSDLLGDGTAVFSGTSGTGE